MALVRAFRISVLLFCVCGPLHAQQSDSDLRKDALRAMKLATRHFRGTVASHGGYVYHYSLDLTERWGEGKAGPDTIFVQPPGTPAVGMAYLKAYAATGDQSYLDTARETAVALVNGQLESGGWTQVIHFAKPQQGRLGNYRRRRGGNWNVSSLDDDQTQAALRFLIRADKALGFKHADIHDAAIFGLDALLKAQFPNGGFPQGWTGPVAQQPVVKAKLPDYDWKTEGKVKNYWEYYTLNDNLAVDVADLLIEAHEVYKDDKYETALRKLGDFLILAQMPEPQPGWCQQYNYEMVPIWARKFEPPAITGWESQGVMQTLIRITAHTGDKKYLQPIPSALAYFKKSLLTDGRVARYYEFKTNKPLYMDAKYQLTYDDTSAPKHYGWTQPTRFDAIERAYMDVRDGKAPRSTRKPKDLTTEVQAIIKDLDDQGRWVSTYAGERLAGQPEFAQGFRYLSSDVFSRHLETLSDYVSVRED